VKELFVPADVPELPIVAMSGKSPDYLGIAVRLGATTSAAKPFTPDQLNASVRTLWNRDRFSARG
jgi:DNA-binding NtrC family response regulator